MSSRYKGQFASAAGNSDSPDALEDALDVVGHLAGEQRADTRPRCPRARAPGWPTGQSAEGLQADAHPVRTCPAALPCAITHPRRIKGDTCPHPGGTSWTRPAEHPEAQSAGPGVRPAWCSIRRRSASWLRRLRRSSTASRGRHARRARTDEQFLLTARPASGRVPDERNTVRPATPRPATSAWPSIRRGIGRTAVRALLARSATSVPGRGDAGRTSSMAPSESIGRRARRRGLRSRPGRKVRNAGDRVGAWAKTGRNHGPPMIRSPYLPR